VTKKANFLTFCSSMAQSVSLPIPLLITPLTHSNSLKLLLFDLFLTQFYLFLLIFLTYLLFSCFLLGLLLLFFFLYFRSTILLLIRNLDNPLLKSFNCISILFYDWCFVLSLNCVCFCIGKTLFVCLFVFFFFLPFILYIWLYMRLSIDMCDF